MTGARSSKLWSCSTPRWWSSRPTIVDDLVEDVEHTKFNSSQMPGMAIGLCRMHLINSLESGLNTTTLSRWSPRPSAMRRSRQSQKVLHVNFMDALPVTERTGRSLRKLSKPADTMSRARARAKVEKTDQKVQPRKAKAVGKVGVKPVE